MDILDIELSTRNLSLLGIAGTGLAWFISHRLSLSRERYAAFRTAVSTFRAAFATELSALRDLRVLQTGQVHEILREAYSKHAAAKMEFAHNLSWLGRVFLRRRWMAYRGPYPIPPELPSEDHRYCLAHFIGSTLDDEEIKRNCAISLLAKLTSYSA